jgi:hypothetical protein
MITKIEVIQEDIDLGTPGDSDNCMLTRAFKRYFPFRTISMAKSFVDIGSQSYKLPTEAAYKSDDFDRGKEVKPFSFDFSIAPDNYMKFLE